MSRAFLALSVLAAASFAAPASALEAEQRVLKETTVTQADGSEKIEYVPADLVTPGETIVYALIFRNDQRTAAEDVVLVMPIPREVTYIEESANNRLARPDFSTDGGTTFSRRQFLTVRDADGSVRFAGADDLTHVRWVVRSPVAPGDVGQLWFRGVLK